MAKAQAKGDAQLAYKEALHRFAHRSYITAIDVGRIYKDGVETDEIGVRIHVKEKKEVSALEASEVLPSEISGVRIDVVQASYAPGAAAHFSPEGPARTHRFATLQPGISVAHPHVTAGTLGMFVRDNRTGRPAILSNWHVLVGSDKSRPGDSIVQPGPMDGGRTERDAIAFLERMILDKDGDAAIAVLNGSRRFSSLLIGTDHRIQGIDDPKDDDLVFKSGRTTGITKGRVEGKGTYFIEYSIGRVGVEGFRIVPREAGNPENLEISAGGDSGAVWVSEKSGSAVGLHFAGETNPAPGAEHALACYITRVFSRLDVELVADEAGTLPQAMSDETVGALASGLGACAVSAALEHLDGREIRNLARSLSVNYPRLSDCPELNEVLRSSAAPEVGPFGAVLIGFAAGAAARLLGKSKESAGEASTAEAFPLVVAAFLAGAVAGARAVDGKL